MARYIDVEVLKNDGHPCWPDGKGNIYYEVDHAPTADVVEVKRGKWEKRTFIVFDNEIKDSYHCSECNTTWDTATNYCPNCGANMRGDK